jgi:predicted ATPase
VTATHRQANAPPRPLTSFVGRESEIATAGAQILRPDVRALPLTGPGGIGKTRPALAIAASFQERVETSVAWVPLAEIHDPALVLPAIARSLGIVVLQPACLLNQICSAVGEWDLVLILDNVEQVVSAATDMAAILSACPGLTLLATSRQPLRISGEHILPVPPLILRSQRDVLLREPSGEADAIRLFAMRAAADSPPFSTGSSTVYRC